MCTLVRVVAPHFVAGLVMREGLCVHAAPILYHRVIGKNRDDLRAVFAVMKWQASIIPSSPSAVPGDSPSRLCCGRAVNS